jgi:hypothetical protein
VEGLPSGELNITAPVTGGQKVAFLHVCFRFALYSAARCLLYSLPLGVSIQHLKHKLELSRFIRELFLRFNSRPHCLHAGGFSTGRLPDCLARQRRWRSALVRSSMGLLPGTPPSTARSALPANGWAAFHLKIPAGERLDFECESNAANSNGKLF